jgi:hypothetical protein
MELDYLQHLATLLDPTLGVLAINVSARDPAMLAASAKGLPQLSLDDSPPELPLKGATFTREPSWILWSAMVTTTTTTTTTTGRRLVVL